MSSLANVACKALAVAALAVALGACSSVGDQGDGTDTGGVDAPPLNSPEARSCSADTDCTSDYYSHPVASVADCYCPTCPSGPLNVSTEMAYEAQWRQLCMNYTPTAHCTLLPCPSGGVITCVDGACQAGSLTGSPR